MLSWLSSHCSAHGSRFFCVGEKDEWRIFRRAPTSYNIYIYNTYHIHIHIIYRYIYIIVLINNKAIEDVSMSSEPWLSCKKSNRYRSCWASPGPPRAGSLGSSKVFAAHNCISSVAGVEMMLRLRAALAGRIMPDDSLISGIIYIYISYIYVQ